MSKVGKNNKLDITSKQYESWLFSHQVQWSIFQAKYSVGEFAELLQRPNWECYFNESVTQSTVQHQQALLILEGGF